MVAVVVLLSLVAAPPPDVYFISIDTIRADHLGMYGHRYDTSPNLDRLAGESLVFDDMICEVPLTSPSFSSMMSSRYPRTTGVTRNGLRMPQDVPLVAERFRAAGYETLCVQSNWTLKSKLSGLDRGFDVYEDSMKQKRWGFLKAERGADDVTRIAKELLAARDPERPVFAWIHYSDPHAPYKLHRAHNVARDFEHPEKGVRRTRIAYDSEIAFMDAKIAELLESLPSGNTVIVVVGDHGESLHEHGYLGHGRHVYQTGMRVPFMVRAQGVAPGRSSRPVRGIDIGPTLLALAGIAAPESMLGRNALANIEPARERVVETYGGAVPRFPGAKTLMAGKPPMRQAVYHKGWKLIVGEDETLLFDLAEDPGEMSDLAAEHPGRVEALRGRIEAWSATWSRSEDAEAADLDAEDVEALETLGYID